MNRGVGSGRLIRFLWIILPNLARGYWFLHCMKFHMETYGMRRRSKRGKRLLRRPLGPYLGKWWKVCRCMKISKKAKAICRVFLQIIDNQWPILRPAALKRFVTISCPFWIGPEQRWIGRCHRAAMRCAILRLRWQLLICSSCNAPARKTITPNR